MDVKDEDSYVTLVSVSSEKCFEDQTPVAYNGGMPLYETGDWDRVMPETIRQLFMKEQADKAIETGKIFILEAMFEHLKSIN